MKLLFCYVEGYLNLIIFEFEFQCSIEQVSFVTLKGSFYQNFEEVCLKLKHAMLWKVQAFMPTVKLESNMSMKSLCMLAPLAPKKKFDAPDPREL